MVKEVFTFLIWLVVETCLKINWFHLTACYFVFFNATRAEEEILEIFVGLETATTNAFSSKLCRVVTSAYLPKVVASFKACLIVESLTVVRENGISHFAWVIGEADDTIFTVCKVELQFFYLFWFYFLFLTFFLIFGFLFFFLSLFSFLFLSLFWIFFPKSILLLAHAELVVSIYVKEHDVSISFGSPATMTTVTSTVALENNCLAAKSKTGTTVVISRIGDIMYFLASIGFYKSDIWIVPSSVTDVGGYEPTTIRTPIEILVAITIAIHVFSIHEFTSLMTLHINSHECGSVL